jgi:hypothetical protein
MWSTISKMVATMDIIALQLNTWDWSEPTTFICVDLSVPNNLLPYFKMNEYVICYKKNAYVYVIFILWQVDRVGDDTIIIQYQLLHADGIINKKFVISWSFWLPPVCYGGIQCPATLGLIITLGRWYKMGCSYRFFCDFFIYLYLV